MQKARLTPLGKKALDECHAPFDGVIIIYSGI